MFTKLQTSCKHRFIVPKRKSTMCRNGDPILPRKKLIGKIKSGQACEHPCHLKKKWRKVIPRDSVTPNAGPGLLLNC